MEVMFYISYFGLAAMISYAFARLEIEIEGRHGWAEKLPTWRKKLKISRYVPGADKELTGYHLYLWLFILMLLHTPLIYIEWSPRAELLILSFYVLVLKLEDFLWFVFNPAFGLQKFNKKSIPWHKEWWGPLPIPYYYAIVIWLILFLGAMRA